MAEGKGQNTNRRVVNSDGTVDRTAMDDNANKKGQKDIAEPLKKEKKDVSSKAMSSLDDAKKRKKPRRRPRRRSSNGPKKAANQEKTVSGQLKPKISKNPEKKVAEKKDSVDQEIKVEPIAEPEAHPIPEPVSEPIPETEDVVPTAPVPEPSEVPEASPVPDLPDNDIDEGSFQPTYVYQSDENKAEEPTIQTFGRDEFHHGDQSSAEPDKNLPDLEESVTPQPEMAEDVPQVPKEPREPQELQEPIQSSPYDMQPEPQVQAPMESPVESPLEPPVEPSVEPAVPPVVPFPTSMAEPEQVPPTIDEVPSYEQIGQPSEVEEVEPELVEHEEREESHEEVRDVVDQEKIDQIKQDIVKGVEGGTSTKAADGIFKTLGPVLKSVFNGKLILSCLGLVVFVGVLYFGWTQNWYGQIVDLIIPEQKKPTEQVGKSDQTVMEEGGLTTAMVVGDNRGSILDLIPSQVTVAQVYGTLSEAMLEGETGITAALYYGELQDEKEFVNQYVTFVDFLDQMRNSYRIDVYDLLDKSTKRTQDLEDYLNDLKDFRTEGNKNLILVGIYRDELQKSYDSLTPDKQQLENDFFTALEDIEAEKSDRLLKSFIDVSQKQIALKARISALSKLMTYYDYALERLDLRIEGIEKNKNALIEGIRVTDVPGSGIDLIIQPE